MWKLTKRTVIAYNIKHKWRTLWYKATTAFDMILLYLQEHPDQTTTSVTLQHFQKYIVQYIEEFNPNPRKTTWS